jgi:hypothetical protein
MAKVPAKRPSTQIKKYRAPFMWLKKAAPRQEQAEFVE